MGFLGKGSDWYLIAWCRLRDGLRAFRGDRITEAKPVGERPPRRPIRVEDLGIIEGSLRTVGPREKTVVNTDRTLSRGHPRMDASSPTGRLKGRP